MKAITCLVYFFCIINMSLICSEDSIEPQQELPIINVDENTEVKQEKNELQDWQNHLQALLNPGEYWNNSDAIPTNDWKTTAFTLAQQAVEKNDSLASDLKSSFIRTINDKIALEKAEHSFATSELITAFDSALNEILTPKEEKSTETVAETSPENNTTDETVVDQPSEKALETTEPEVNEELPTTTEQKQETQDSLSAQEQWSRYLDTLSDQDLNNRDDFIKNAQKIAYNTLSPLPLHLQQESTDAIKKEFENAIELQAATKGLGAVNPYDVIKQFNKELDATIAEKQQEAAASESGVTPEQYQNNAAFTTEATNETQGIPVKDTPTASFQTKDMNISYPKDTISQEINTQPTTITTVLPTEQALPSVQIPISNIPYSTGPTHDETDLASKEYETMMRQKALKQALVLQIEQRAQREAEKQKNQTIIASLIEKVFHVDIDEWLASHKKGLAADVIPEAIDTFLGSENNEEKRAMKKTAYLTFQKTLLSYSSAEFWDKQLKGPNQAWLNKIKNELAILINYKMITIKQSLDVIDQALSFQDKVSQENRSAIKKNIQDFLETILRIPFPSKNRINPQPLVALLK